LIVYRAIIPDRCIAKRIRTPNCCDTSDTTTAIHGLTFHKSRLVAMSAIQYR
jgi:hypothetical protein